MDSGDTTLVLCDVDDTLIHFDGHEDKLDHALVKALHKLASTRATLMYLWTDMGMLSMYQDMLQNWGAPNVRCITRPVLVRELQRAGILVQGVVVRGDDAVGEPGFCYNNLFMPVWKRFFTGRFHNLDRCDERPSDPPRSTNYLSDSTIECLQLIDADCDYNKSGAARVTQVGGTMHVERDAVVRAPAPKFLLDLYPGPQGAEEIETNRGTWYWMMAKQQPAPKVCQDAMRANPCYYAYPSRAVTTSIKHTAEDKQPTRVPMAQLDTITVGMVIDYFEHLGDFASVPRYRKFMAESTSGFPDRECIPQFGPGVPSPGKACGPRLLLQRMKSRNLVIVDDIPKNAESVIKMLKDRDVRINQLFPPSPPYCSDSDDDNPVWQVSWVRILTPPREDSWGTTTKEEWLAQLGIRPAVAPPVAPAPSRCIVC
jgi:hypothetical protein